MHARLQWLVLAGAGGSITMHAEHAKHSPLQPLHAAERQHVVAERTTHAGHLLLGPNGTQSHIDNFLASGHPATPQACLEDFPTTYREACLSQFDMSKQQHVEELLGACDWIAEGTTTNLNVSRARNGVAGLGYPDDETTAQHPREFVPVGDFTIGRCIGPRGGAGRDVDQWEFVRVGPFNTTGGWDWHSFRSCESADITPDAPCRQFSAFDAHADLFPGFGKHFEWPDGVAKRVLAVSEYVQVTMDASGHLLGYPPHHQHHFHIEPNANDDLPVPTDIGAQITHGDDQCVESAGGVNCAIRRAPSGYATKMTLPFWLTSDVNDVRAEGSAPLSWFLLIAIKGRPDDGHRQSLTQMRMLITPSQPTLAYFGTYVLPSNATSVFWREGTFTVTAPVLWSYFHNHGSMGDEMLLYVGANSTQLRMDDVRPIGTEISTGLTSAQLDTAKRRLAANARAAGAQLTCHYQRTESQLEVPIPETAETANHLWRKAAACVPFQISTGLPFVVLVVNKPDSDEAAQGAHVTGMQEDHLAMQHTIVRLFFHHNASESPVCGLGCGYDGATF